MISAGFGLSWRCHIPKGLAKDTTGVGMELEKGLATSCPLGWAKGAELGPARGNVGPETRLFLNEF